MEFTFYCSHSTDHFTSESLKMILPFDTQQAPFLIQLHLSLFFKGPVFQRGVLRIMLQDGAVAAATL